MCKLSRNRFVEPVFGFIIEIMKINRKPTVFVLIFASLASLILITGCSGFGDIFKKPTANIESIEITELDFTSVSLLVNVEIENSNPVGLTLSAYDYGLDVAEATVLDGRKEEPTSLKASGVSLISIPVDVTFKQLVSAGTSIITDDVIPVDLRMGLEITIPYMGTVRLDLSGGIEIPAIRPPVIRPTSLKVNDLSLTGAEIALVMNVENPNRFDITLSTLSGSLSIGGNEWGIAGAESGAWLPEGSDVVVVMLARIDFVEVGRTAWSLLAGSGNADVQLSGDMDLDMDLPGFKGGGFPFDADAKVSIIR